MDVLGYNAMCNCLDGIPLYQKQIIYRYDHISDRRCLDAIYLGNR